MNVNDTLKGNDTQIRRMRVSGSVNHVNISASYTKGERAKQLRFTFTREEALDVAASILCVLSDGERERMLTASGLTGNSMLRFPYYSVYSDECKGPHTRNLARDKPVMVQENAKGEQAFLTIDGKYCGVVTAPKDHHEQRATWGLIRLPIAGEK